MLSLVMVFSLFPALFNNPVKAATTSQNNIVARADYFYNLTWTAQSTVYGWNYNYTFYAGSTYRVPYGQPINSGAYVGYYVSIDDFLTAANTAGSVFYTSRSTYSSTSSVYYATDCSAFVSWCWGVDRKTTYSIPQVSTYIGMATAANAYSLQLGDCLNSNDVGHVVLVTDLVYSGTTLTSIEITEQTPPQMKRSYYTPSELGAKYGTYYGIYRYTGEVPAAPAGSTNDDTGSSATGSTTTITSKYYPACDSSYTSLNPAMASIGVTLDWDLQCQIAELNGITDYSGTAEQNTTLLNLLKAGTLLNPNYVEVSYYAACDSSCTTFYEGMSNIGIDCDWTLHCEIAAANGITDFSGTADQNNTLLALLKAGKLIIPGAGASEDSDSSVTVTDGKTGYDRGYTGGMAGTGEYKAFGLDVSAWQGSDLDFSMIKNAGYDFVILRAGTSKGKDSLFDSYYTKAKAAGLDVGAYYYSYALDVAAATTDANNMISYLAGKQFEYPIYFDYEDSTQLELSSSLSQDICLTFMDMLADEGYLVGLYTGKYFSTQIPTSTICAKYEIWIAHYLAVGDGVYDGTYDYTTYGPSYSTQYGMFQFTDSVWINGNGHYDGDVAFKDYPTIVKTYGFNGYDAAITSAYFDQCTFYPAHCTFKATAAAAIYSEPRPQTDDNTSEKLGNVVSGSSYTAIGLYENTDGDLYYEIETADGEKGYVYAGDTEFVAAVTTDITVTEYDVPNGHVAGDYFLVTGTVSSTYNRLDQAQVYIYSGFGLDGTPVTGSSAAAADNRYVLNSSAIDTATSFGDLSVGNYTYYIGASYTGYYAKDGQTLGTVSDTVTLEEHYFTTIASSVSQSGCAHSNSETVLVAATCTTTGSKVTSCSICGLIEEGIIEPLGHSYDSETVTKAATCTTAGSKTISCTSCGSSVTETIPAAGHSYNVVSHEATCTQYAVNEYTCAGCGDHYKEYAGEWSDWTTEKPDVDEVLIESKTQYRYSDYETLTSYEANLAGYTLLSSQWEQSGTGSVTYVKSWPSGFPTTSSAYATYNNIGSKVTASETATNKTVVNSDALAGYLWYHWCSNSGNTSTASETDTNWCFHVFFSTTAPSQADNYDSSDGSYKLSSSTHCAYCVWYWPIEVYKQEYTAYQNQFIYERWTDWSAWSDETATTSDTRKVENRTLYRYVDAQLADHSWNNGVVTTAATCTTDGAKTYTCTTCSATKTEIIAAYGHNWSGASCTQPSTCSACGQTGSGAAGHSYASTVTTAPTCTADGVRTYLCSACGHSYTETISRLGHSYSSAVTAPTCTSQGYTTHTCSTCGSSYSDSYTDAAGHSYTSEVTKAATCTDAGAETFTCSKCSDSYTETVPVIGHHYISDITAPTCTEQGYTTHECDRCGGSYQDGYTNPIGHSYVGTTCSACGIVRDYYLIGFINGADYGCQTDWENLGSYKFIDGKLTVTFNSDSYVFVKTGDNASWYMTNGYCTDKTATLYNTNSGIADANKMHVPGGTEINFTLVVNSDETLVLSYVINTCEHSYQTSVVDPSCVAVGSATHTCSKCSYSYTEEIPATGHSYAGGKCGSCGDTKAVSLPGDFNSWTAVEMTWTASGYTYTMDLAAGTYTFKVIKDGTWLGNDGTIEDTTAATSDLGWEFTDWGGNCSLVATGGKYTFAFNIDTNMLVITKAHTHSYTYSYDKTNSLHNFTCTQCGETFSEAAESKFGFNTAAPTLSDDIVMNIATTVPTGFYDPYMVVEFNGVTTTVNEYTINSSNGRYVFAFAGINPQTMGDTFHATLYATFDGVQVRVELDYSMLKYINSQLKKATISAVLRTALSDLVMYGQYNQIHEGYKTDALLSTLLESTATLTPSTFPGLDDSYYKQATSGTKDANIDLKGVTLVLGSKLRVRVTVYCADASAYTVKATINGEEHVFNVSDLALADGYTDRYVVEFDKIRATQFGEEITFTFQDADGNQVGRSLTYTVYTYIQKNQNTTDENLANLLKAIYNYGESVKKL